MTKDVGVWTADDCTLVLIDYQKEMFEVIRSETSADLVEMHVRLLVQRNHGLALRVDDTPGRAGVACKRSVGFWTTLTL